MTTSTKGAETPRPARAELATRHARIEAAVREILTAVGEDPSRDGLRDTPARVARMYDELLNGHLTDPDEHLEVTFDHAHDEMVVVKDIQFQSLCEHHLLPFFGTVAVGYLPSERIVGLSKLARVVEHPGSAAPGAGAVCLPDRRRDRARAGHRGRRSDGRGPSTFA